MKNLNTVKLYQPHVGWLHFERGDEVAIALQRGFFEAREQLFFRSYLRTGDGFIDAGAHVGLFSVLAGLIVGEQGHILSFEPDSKTRNLLVGNLRENNVQNVEVFPSGLWNENGTLGLHREAEGMSSHNFLAELEGDDDKTAESVDVVRLSTVEALGKCDHWELLKIDCEGAEPNILQDALGLIVGGKIKAALVEFNEHNLKRNGSSTTLLLAMIRASGAEVYRFSEDVSSLSVVESNEPIWYENLIITADVDFVTQRMSECDQEASQIIDDILGRARACDLHEELQELSTYRSRSIERGEVIERLEEEKSKLLDKLDRARSEMSQLQSEIAKVPRAIRWLFLRIR